jgi:hypothetical protein
MTGEQQGGHMSAMTTAQWSVSISIGERDGRTHAEARLHTKDDTHLSGSGTARLRPTDRDVPEIGEEIATARALIDLAYRLLHAAADDIEGVTHEHVQLDH